MEYKIKLAIAEPYPVIVEGIRSWLAGADDIEIVGIVGTEEGLHRLLNKDSVDVLLLEPELKYPEDSERGRYSPLRFIGFDGMKRIKKASPNTKVILFTKYNDPGITARLLRSGADGYIHKADMLELPFDLASLLRAAQEDNIMQGPFRAFALLRQDDTDVLTDSELEMLIYMAKHPSDNIEEIAQGTGKAPGTVNAYSTRMYKKLGVNSRAEAILTALHRRIIPIEVISE